jgi:hypothetical protein
MPGAAHICKSDRTPASAGLRWCSESVTGPQPCCATNVCRSSTPAATPPRVPWQGLQQQQQQRASNGSSSSRRGLPTAAYLVRGAARLPGSSCATAVVCGPRGCHVERVDCGWTLEEKRLAKLGPRRARGPRPRPRGPGPGRKTPWTNQRPVERARRQDKLAGKIRGRAGSGPTTVQFSLSRGAALCSLGRGGATWGRAARRTRGSCPSARAIRSATAEWKHRPCQQPPGGGNTGSAGRTASQRERSATGTTAAHLPLLAG